ncbi:MAG: ABC transporter permease [Methanomicrobiaceae archaeon]|nr:ABC transporter permease [Methanomicrobiaceae archaeon]
MRPGSFLTPDISRAVWTVWRRNRDVFFKTYRVNFLPPLLEPVLYLVALGIGLGSFVGEIDGIMYIRYIAPALLAISTMNTAFFECTYGSFVRMYYMKTFDAMVATPLTIDEVIAGELLWGATRSFIYVSIMLLILLVFGVVDIPASLLVIPFSFAGGLLFASIGMCFTALTPGIDELNYPSFLFITPMFLFSGTFFPLSVLPDTVRYLALALLPLTHVVTVTRSLTLTHFSPFIFVSLGWIVLATAVFFLLAIHLMKKRLVT